MDWSFITEVSAHLLRGLPSFGGAVLVLIAARFLFLLSTQFKVGEDLLDAENPATGVVFGAYIFGVAIALVGTLFGRGQDGTLIAMGKILVEGAVAIVLMRISISVNDRFILHRFCIVKEIREDNDNAKRGGDISKDNNFKKRTSLLAYSSNSRQF